jgi:N-methylhydantoinase B
VADPIRLEIFKHLFASVAEEMGVTLGRTGYSPNIKERLDYSCALFMGDGRLLAQAAHIPVHLGAMPASVRAALERCAPFSPGDLVILNDPYHGGTHLPDVTLVSPVFVEGREMADFFVASRAHHADIGGMSPGSMPLSTEIYQEGLIIPPIKLIEGGQRNEAVWDLILRNVRTPAERQGDLAAQIAAHTIGARRAAEIVDRYGLAEVMTYAEALLAYTERVVRSLLATVPPGRYEFEDCVEAPPGAEGAPGADLPLRVAVTVSPEGLLADFTGTTWAMDGNLNAVSAIAESAAAYVLRCLVATVSTAEVPMNAGAFAPLRVVVPPGSLLDARPPRAVAAGNVETSQRVVDVLLGALAQALPSAVPAASQGTMNNLTFGGRLPGDGQPFAYYETMGGGAGGGPHPPGAVAASGVHVHMSNTRNTPIEALEHALPVRVERYSLRRGSGGAGRCRGGDGLQRDLRFLAPVTATLLTERRRLAPWGLAGGQPGARGRNRLLRAGASAADELPGKCTLTLQPGDVLSIETPGGGGWGEPA